MTRDLNELLPIVKQKAEQLISKCKEQGIELVVTGTYRTIAEQDALYAQGRTTSGNIVTKAKGGQSLHNWRVAFDCVPLVDNVPTYNNSSLWAKIGEIATSLGLECGMYWEGFKDSPHFQYTLGHTWQDFQAGAVDLSKFNIKTMENTNNDAYVHSPETPAEAAGTTGDAVIFTIINKATGEVVPHKQCGSNSEGNFIAILEDGTEITFVGESKENDTYSVIAK